MANLPFSHLFGKSETSAVSAQKYLAIPERKTGPISTGIYSVPVYSIYSVPVYSIYSVPVYSIYSVPVYSIYSVPVYKSVFTYKKILPTPQIYRSKESTGINHTGIARYYCNRSPY